jgi:hypothetical protein
MSTAVSWRAMRRACSRSAIMTPLRPSGSIWLWASRLRPMFSWRSLSCSSPWRTESSSLAIDSGFSMKS